MARTSAINAVATGVLNALNVSAFRALCPGGVYRNEPLAQAPPYASIGPCEETPWNACGTNYGSEVVVPVRILTSGADASGESRAMSIVDAALGLLETRGSLTATGWTVCDIWWQRTVVQAVVNDEGATGYEATAFFLVQVRA